IKARQKQAFELSDLDAAAESVSCNSDDALALLALLSRPSAKILTMHFNSDLDATDVPPSEFSHMLTEWWRRKSISDDEWIEWATNITVSWTPVIEEEIHDRQK